MSAKAIVTADRPQNASLPIFKIGQKVKFVNDSDSLAGEVIDMFYSSGWSYKITSKFFDSEVNDMVVGYKICKQEELVNMDIEI